MSRRVGGPGSWLYSIFFSGCAMVIYAVLLRGDRRAAVRPWPAVVDALWAGVVYGTAIWILVAFGRVTVQKRKNWRNALGIEEKPEKTNPEKEAG